MSNTAEFDGVDAETWHRLLQDFEDASIFQSWAYGKARWGRQNLSHAVVREGDEVIGLAQTVIVSLPLFGKTLAYVVFGPVWRRRGGASDIDRLKAVIGALREEYVVRRFLCLRLRPWDADLDEVLREGMAACGFREKPQSPSSYSTFILDLSGSEAELRKAMDRRWRSNLRKAEQLGLTVTREVGGEAIRIFSDIHGQMERRKGFSSDFAPIFPALYEGVPAALRPEVFVCWHDGLPVASAIVSAIGDRAFYLNGATLEAALEVRAGYFLQWAILRWLKENGLCRWYDLYGAASNPGVRQFKRGLVGAKAPEIRMNDFEACERKLAASLVGVGEGLYRLRRRMKRYWVGFGR